MVKLLREENMSKGAASIEMEKLFADHHDINQIMSGQNGSEVSWKLREEVGEGYIQVIKLKPGLALGISNYRLTESVAVDFAFDFTAISFTYCLSGAMNYGLDYGNDNVRKKFKGAMPGHCVITYMPTKWSGIAVPPAGTTVIGVGIYVEPSLCKSLMAGEQDMIPANMRDIINGICKRSYYQILTLPSFANMAIQQIFDCPYQGSLQHMYFESKVLELMTHSLAQLAPSPACSQRKTTLLPSEIEKVHLARELVKHNLANPPTLLDIASKVGIHHSRLNVLFRELFGTTIFNHLREARLAKAKSLLTEGGMNVTEVTYEVGYSSISHFCKNFQEYHNISPSHYLRKMKSKGGMVK